MVCALNRDTFHAAHRQSCGVMLVANKSLVSSRIAKTVPLHFVHSTRASPEKKGIKNPRSRDPDPIVALIASRRSVGSKQPVRNVRC